jgi:hypothetical protein
MNIDPVWRLIVTGEAPPRQKVDVLAHLPTAKDLDAKDRRRLKHILKKQAEFENKRRG